MAESIAFDKAGAEPPVSVSHHGDVRIVEFMRNKVLDEATISEIGRTLNALIDERDNPRLLLDFAHVDHLSSSALGMLIDVNKRLRQANGQLRLANIRPQIYEIFSITRLDTLFYIQSDREAALASFS